MQNNPEVRVYAGFFVRLAAYLIDWLIVGTALLAVRIPFWILGLTDAGKILRSDFIFQYSVYDIVLYLLKTAYFADLFYRIYSGEKTVADLCS